MLKIENAEVWGFRGAIRGMRNSYGSWDKADSGYIKAWDDPIPGFDMMVEKKFSNEDLLVYSIGEEDKKLALKLILGGEDHATFMDHIQASFDLTLPLSVWKQMDRYTIGRQRPLSTSTMHTLCKNSLSQRDFADPIYPETLEELNRDIEQYKDLKAKGLTEAASLVERRIINNLPQSYLQMRTMEMNYTTLRRIYRQRRGHKMIEWRVFLNWIERLPYSWLITSGLEVPGV